MIPKNERVCLIVTCNAYRPSTRKGQDLWDRCPRVTCHALTNLPEPPCPSDQSHRTAELQCCWGPQFLMWASETARLSAVDPAEPAGWLAGLLRRERLFIGVELLLSPDVDLVLRRSGKHVIQLPVVMNGRTSALGKSTHCLLLLWGGDRYDLKTRLREQGLFLYQRYLLVLIVFSYILFLGVVVCV